MTKLISKSNIQSELVPANFSHTHHFHFSDTLFSLSIQYDDCMSVAVEFSSVVAGCVLALHTIRMPFILFGIHRKFSSFFL